MIRVIIAYDDNDDVLGEYFEDSFNEIRANFIDNENITIISIRGLECTEENIIENLPINNTPFIFIGLSHGNEEQLATNNGFYVDSKNISHFKKSLFYTPACKTGLDLGKKLIDADCQIYIGFTINSSASTEEFYSLFYSCENYCIIEFLKGEKTIGTAFDEMLNNFDIEFNKLVDNNEIIVAQDLLDNRNGLVLYGNKGLRSADFDI